jgi:hypothetical protein
MVGIAKRSLAETHPELAAQADGWDPTTVSAGSGRQVRWICNFGHVWKSTINNRKNGNGCPVCSGRSVLVGFNDLQTTHPELAAQADGWNPTTVTAGSHKKVGWICNLNHQWQAQIYNRKNGNGCPVCSGQKVLVGFNDLQTTHPDVAANADGWDPRKLLAGSNAIVGWKCEFNHQWKAKLANVANGHGCPVCSGRSVLAGFNDLQTTNPELAEQADGWNPTTLKSKSGRIMNWKCNYNHTWRARLDSRSYGLNCPVCSGQKVLVGFNDLQTTHPELAAQADGWNPTTVTAGSHKKVGWICNLNHQWSATVSSRTSGTGCPSCAKFGFDPNQPAFLYLINHFDLQMFQIGITNFPNDRLGDHKRRGWEVIELRGPMDGQLTQNLETNCLHALEKRGAILGHKAGIEKFDGYSEAWTKASLNVTSIKQILDWVYEDETK